MKKWLITAIVALVIILGLYVLSRPKPVTVSLVPVESGVVERTVANTRAGTVEACFRARMSMPIGGQIATLAVREGDQVEKGQLLMALWNEDRQARVSEAQAAVKAAELEKNSRCIGADSDRREARRLAQLVEQKLVSAESADIANARADASAAGCQAAKARVTQANAAVTVAEATLEQTILRAPFAGIVADVTGEVGEFSTPSPPGIPTPPAIDLITHDCHYISAPIDEVDASEIAPGMPVRVTLDAFRDRTFAATVRRIAPYVQDYEKQARTVEVEAELAPLPEDVILLAGYSADMEVILDTHENSLRVPSELVLEDNHVLVLDDAGMLREQPVTRGLSNWRYTEIIAGLQQGDKIVGNIGSQGVEVGASAVVAADND